MRVSTYGATPDARLEQMRGTGCSKFYRKTVAGEQPERRHLLHLMKMPAPGNVVTVSRIGSPPLDLQPVRHHQAHREFKRELSAAGQHRHKYRAADDCRPRRTSASRARLIRTRTAEGRRRATACDQHTGRPPKLTPQQQQEARRRRAEGATLKELAKSYNVGQATISRLAAGVTR
jgi:hypothetical protein